MEKTSKILIAGAHGLIGQYLLNELRISGYANILTPTSIEVDWTDSVVVNQYFKYNRPQYVFLLAARKAGVAEYEKTPVEFLNINLQIELNVMNACYEYNAGKLLFAGASSIYKENQKKIISEYDFPNGWVQKATEPYSLAKAVGTKLCEYYNKEYGMHFVSALLSNIYGYTDQKHFDKASVIPSLILRFIDGVENSLPEVAIWGDGKSNREFLHASDCASALLKIMESNVNLGWINVGCGEVISINELAECIAKLTGFKGVIINDLTKPNGSQRSVLDISRLKSLGWEPKISLEEGIKDLIDRIR